MSDDFLETIWAQYAVETEEHIESIESLLVKADAGELSADEVSGLFRAFHSLKGLSRERIGMEMLNLLGLPDPAPTVARMEELGVLAQVCRIASMGAELGGPLRCLPCVRCGPFPGQPSETLGRHRRRGGRWLAGDRPAAAPGA